VKRIFIRFAANKTGFIRFEANKRCFIRFEANETGSIRLFRIKAIQRILHAKASEYFEAK
jgi:hypothetical protein